MADEAKDLAVVPGGGQVALVGEGMSVEKLKARRALIVTVMRDLMKDGQHYGKIPGCGDTPTLLKAGADLLCSLFGLRPEYAQETTTEGGFIRVSTTCKIFTYGGLEVGEGIGTASTGETKWLWKKCWEDEYERTPEDKRRGWWVTNDNGSRYFKRQVMQEPSDALNTVTQMSAKRAYVQAVRAALAVGDLFAQDLEELQGDEDTAGSVGDDAPPPPPSNTKEPQAPPKKEGNGNGGGHHEEGEQAPVEVWTGQLVKVSSAPFTDSKKQKRVKWYLTGDDRTQFQTIFEDKGKAAEGLQGKQVEVKYRVSRFGNDLVAVKGA